MAADHTADEKDVFPFKAMTSSSTTDTPSSPIRVTSTTEHQHSSSSSDSQQQQTKEENAMIYERGGIATMTSSSFITGGDTAGGTEQYPDRSPQQHHQQQQQHHHHHHHQHQQHHHSHRPTLPPLLPTSVEHSGRELAPLGRSPAQSHYPQPPSSPSTSFNNPAAHGDDYSSNSVYNPRRFRSASEATAHHPPYRSLFAPPPPPFSKDAGMTGGGGHHSHRDGPYLREPPHNLPSLSRFSANIRRSNTFSAGLLYYNSPLSGSSSGGGQNRPSMQLLPPSSNNAHRIFSRKFSDAASTTSSSSSSFRPQLPSLGASVSSPSFSSGSAMGSPHHHQSSWQQQYPSTAGGGGSGMMTGAAKEPLTPGGMSTSSSFSTTTTTSSGLATAAAANLSGFGGPAGSSAYSPSSSSTVKGGNRRRETSISESSSMNTTIGGGMEDFSPNSRKVSKSHVPSACLNCKKAHLACDVNRPCRRCINLGKVDTCVDVRHKKRGRPRLRDRELSNNSITMFNAPHPNSNPNVATSNSSSTSPPRTTMPHTPPHYQSMHNHTSPYHVSGMGRDRSVSSASMGGMMEGTTIGGIGRTMPPIKVSEHNQDPSTNPTSELNSQMQNWMIFSTSLHCARCSPNVEEILQLFSYPDEFLGKFFLDFIHPNDVEKVQKMWNLLIEPVDVPVQPIYAHPETIMQMQKEDLLSPATGTVFLREENIRIRSNNSSLIDEQQQNRGGSRNTEDGYASFTVGFHLGGGAFGVDLYRKHTFDRAYIVVTIW